jgi:hypothetical protein
MRVSFERHSLLCKTFKNNPNHSKLAPVHLRLANVIPKNIAITRSLYVVCQVQQTVRFQRPATCQLFSSETGGGVMGGRYVNNEQSWYQLRQPFGFNKHRLRFHPSATRSAHAPVVFWVISSSQSFFTAWVCESLKKIAPTPLKNLDTPRGIRSTVMFSAQAHCATCK